MTGLASVMRPRRHDGDRALSQTMVYVMSALVITGVYVIVVAGLGQLIGGDETSTVLAITATAFVAVAFQPLRQRLQRLVDSVVHGRKATPHEVLSEFSRRVAVDDDALVGLAARSLVEGTAASRVGVWVSVDRQLVETAAWPSAGGGLDEDVASLPISNDGVELGCLTLSVRSGQRLSEQDELLARRVASSMGLALGNRVRTESLQSRVEQLRRSRRRLVAVLDDTRRQLERDLHDGAQQQLVALKVKLALAHSMSKSDGATNAAATLRDLTDAADVTVDAMRDFGRGLYPPLMEAEGLVPVIKSRARQAPIPVTVDVERVGRYDREVETTINLCISQALENVERHAQATTARVTIAQHNGAVTFSVRDDGVGFDVAGEPLGVGMTNMADRIDAVAGTFTVESTPGQGTTILGTIPVDEGEPS